MYIQDHLVASSTYWYDVYGYTKEYVLKDKEGTQTMHNLANSMIFLMNAIQDGEKKYSHILLDKLNRILKYMHTASMIDLYFYDTKS